MVPTLYHIAAALIAASAAILLHVFTDRPPLLKRIAWACAFSFAVWAGWCIWPSLHGGQESIMCHHPAFSGAAAFAAIALAHAIRPQVKNIKKVPGAERERARFHGNGA